MARRDGTRGAVRWLSLGGRLRACDRIANHFWQASEQTGAELTRLDITERCYGAAVVWATPIFSIARSTTACNSRAYFTSRPLARIFLVSSGLNQVGFRVDSCGSSASSTSSRNALITYSRTPGDFQKTPLEWM